MESSKVPWRAPPSHVLGWKGGEVICARRDGELRRSPPGRILYLPALDSSMQITCSDPHCPRDAFRPRKLGSLNRDTIKMPNESRLMAGQRGRREHDTSGRFAGQRIKDGFGNSVGDQLLPSPERHDFLFDTRDLPLTEGVLPPRFRSSLPHY